ncbi:N-acylglucosamine 2-epimerase [Ethanoligenens harbinense YUAN-3]|uniref:Cellobiose 2-epimerase n=1 Tax=Ethanoligenens harbinense (strain DSM 18485 / JCM 12961 / CGMCC 1.5033 / YUAN-3) TaxID=663278 RepID=E6U3H3_ETHHY|nr:AGE family epimerase/isomerase [Ethanoligenens harbinense]ADU26465.1 N-acylglucosamine 2-epimerase [Ethanoligenens harbinense YUAN-3]AVQ95594.1 N-acylglucosamine 2-epimerase [Ethanoligenens harbinense YUAN-3]AYF38258.1 N-acylglucosamine 2-epimerase [Ethanoligenens harbinense]AYF41004.1 N-acylglucosamine 2-epimerase [Ethanoligenens harbinense]QCN91834.1 N-acylglucosamine 2-epimerase [Ethanoligenens harbinense]
MLLDEVTSALTDNIIPFWKGLRDDAFGGYYGLLDFDLNLDKQAEKGCILNNRILWFFSTAAKALGRSDLLDEARHAYVFLKGNCLDKEYGGIYWSLNYDGSVKDSTKHTYNQAFAIYALSAYYELTRDEEALTLARGLYKMIEAKCTDEIGYLEAFDRSFKPVSNEKLSENGVLADKTMNTLLHVFEGYSGLYQASGDADVGESLRHILETFISKVYNPEKRRQEVFFDRELHSILDLHSYGHDIETSWLMDWGCGLLKDPALTAKLSPITSALAEQIYKTAYHKNSIWNECDRGVENKTRVWWVQAEGILGFLNEYQKSGRREFLQAAEDVWGYIRTYLVDPRPGSEWFWEVDDDGKPSSKKPIVEPWKCPYHNGRMCLEVIRRNINAAC